jgi:hypothetical protein
MAVNSSPAPLCAASADSEEREQPRPLSSDAASTSYATAAAAPAAGGAEVAGNGVPAATAALAAAGEQPTSSSAPPLTERQKYQRELRRVLSLAIPLATQNIAGFTLSVISAASIGRLGHVYFSASVLVSACDTLAALSRPFVSGAPLWTSLLAPIPSRVCLLPACRPTAYTMCQA